MDESPARAAAYVSEPRRKSNLAQSGGDSGHYRSTGVARPTQPNRWLSLMLIGITLPLALFMSLLLATGQLFPLAAISSAVVIVLATAFIIQIFGGRHDGLFWLLLASVFLASIASAVTRRPLTFLSTGILLAAAPLIAYCVFERIKWSRHAVLLLVLCAAFFLVAILASVLGRSRFFSAAYTAILALKPFLLVGCGTAFLWTRKTNRAFNIVVYWAWLPLLAAAIVQWYFPSLYLAVLADVEAIPENNPMFIGFPRATGLFQHPSVLATTSAVFGLICIADALLTRKLWVASPAIIYCVLILMTGQRQELAAFMLCLPILVIVCRYRLSFFALISLLATTLVCLALILYVAPPAFVDRIVADWQQTSSSGMGSARAVLYHDAIQTANDYWPLGSGLGTFSSVGAVRFDQSYFLELGYQAFWWFKGGKYLLDAYWAKYIGETGWIGFTIHLLFYLVVLHAIVGWLNEKRVRANAEATRYSLLAFIGLSYVLIASPTAFNLSEPHGGLVAMVFIGIAWQRVIALRSRDSDREPNTKSDRQSNHNHHLARQSSALVAVHPRL